jgi:hypothetical protein
MGRTVSYYNIFGTSKAKTEKAILVLNDAGTEQAWMPLRVAQVKFIGKDYKVKVTVPDWFFRKISWVPAQDFKPTAKSAPTNPYIGQDVGNILEEMMVLQEMNPPNVAKTLQMMQEALDLAKEAA